MRSYTGALRVPQNERLDNRQVENNAGGYVYQIHPLDRLRRFLILGADGGTYYVKPGTHVRDNLRNVTDVIDQYPEQALSLVKEVSTEALAPRNTPAILVLAKMCADKISGAWAVMPQVCRTGTHLFEFLAAYKAFFGKSNATMRKALQQWYMAKTHHQRELQVLKYRQREGWIHKDVLRLCHLKTKEAVFELAVKGQTDQLGGKLLEGYKKIQTEQDKKAQEKLIIEHRLPRELVPTELLTRKGVWEALLQDMPYMAMIRNLGVMGSIDLLKPMSNASKEVVNRIVDIERIGKSRIHPFQLFVAAITYAKGKGFRGSKSWTPVPQITDALEEAFYLAFKNVQPTGKSYYIGLDVSGSMTWESIANSPVNAAEAAGAMAMINYKTEKWSYMAAFSDKMREISLTQNQTIEDLYAKVRAMSFGGTDCALPMLDALQKRIEADVFIVYTDSETWAGNIHPVQALDMYNNKMGRKAKLVVAGMTSTGFSIADPQRKDMLDIVGFDASAPALISNFAKDKI